MWRRACRLSREYRLILILLAMAGLGVSGLVLVADQYRKSFVPVEDTSLRAARLVDGFLAARQAATLSVSSNQGASFETTVDASTRYRIARADALAKRGLSSDDYAVVRSAWRQWKAGRPTKDPALVAAFQERRLALEIADLGANEAFDDAVK